MAALASDWSGGVAPGNSWRPQPGSQVLFLSCPVFECLYEGTRGPGKSQSVDEVVMTPAGQRRIGDLRPGDEVLGSDGLPQRVVSVHPQGMKPLWRVTFTDGTTAEASPDHLWQTAATGQGKRWQKRVVTTRQMREAMARGKTLSIPLMSGPAQFPERALPVDPYLMGLYLGDGCSRAYSVVITTADRETSDYLLAQGFLPKAPIGYRAPGPDLLHRLRDMGLQGLKSKDKFVPEEYLWGSADQRLALLQGLMDTDGSVKRDKNQLRFGTTSPRLAEAVMHLIRSLGGWSTSYEAQRPDCKREYEVTGYLPDMASAFRLTRKRALCSPRDLQDPGSRVKRYVASVEEIGECEQVCIRVDREDHLYVTRDFVVTHNTDALLMDFAQHVGRGYGAAWRGILFRETYPQLADVIAKSKKWFKSFFPRAQYNESATKWVFPDGEELLLRHMKKADDYWNYHGHEYPWIGWEELTNWANPDCYLRMMSCCRCSTAGVPRKYRATTNPYGRGHNWVKRRFQLPQMRGRVIKDPDGRDRVAIHGTIHENRILLAADPNYVKTVSAAARNDNERKAWLEGSWEITAGGMFDDLWRSDVHVVDPFPIPRSWRVDRSFDWGSSKPFSVGWWAESDGTDVVWPDGRRRSTVRGDLFRIGEWYGWTGVENEGLRMLATAIADGIVGREVALGIRARVRPGPADSAIFDAEPGKTSIATDMAAHGVTWEPADKGPGSRKQGWEQMRKLMTGALPSVGGGPREAPGLFVFRTCDEGFLRTIPVIPRDDKDLDDVDTEAEDHAADEARYRCRHKRTAVGVGRTR